LQNLAEVQIVYWNTPRVIDGIFETWQVLVGPVANDQRNTVLRREVARGGPHAISGSSARRRLIELRRRRLGNRVRLGRDRRSLN
jgi:hypothetical protein